MNSRSPAPARPRFRLKRGADCLMTVGTPIYNGAWQGTFTIDETGVIAGTVTGPPSTISGTTPVLTPAF